MTKVCVVLSLFAAGLAITSALSDADIAAIRAEAMPVVTACAAEFKITKADVQAAKESKNIDALDPCFFACVHKKFGLINDSGLFDVEKAKEIHAKFLSSDEDKKKMDDITNKCASVNDATVSDGAKGCERAKLLVACMIKERAPYSPL